ncbi:hypothetical protein D869_gp221 [Caulobacter phage CcrRogue]|uniref:Uncharacterized protein n=1 Tax=Caulobacter phage CcrRogue TaxID=2927986 RepID=K4JSH1_9CAUD|nr:hypothetical protein D869_gp221 [Caulobacter phage CcrRogue]AFU86693.1 hypothetical protein CcrRogue_gp211 [Caulobacter phage CcrRogue]
MTNDTPKLGAFLGAVWINYYHALIFLVVLLYACLIHPFLFIGARLWFALLARLPQFDFKSALGRLQYRRRGDPLAGGWNLDAEASFLGGGFIWRSISWQGFKRFDLGWRWLIRLAIGGMNDVPMMRGRRENHAYVSLGLLGFSLDIGKLGDKFRVRLFFNGRRLFYHRGLEALT